MHTTLEHLTPQQNFDLQILVHKVVSSCPVSKIVYYCNKLSNSASVSCLNNWQVEQQSKLVVGLLIVPAEEATCSGAHIIQLVHSASTPRLTAHCIVYKPAYAGQPADGSNSFVNKVFTYGKVIYLNSADNTSRLTEVNQQPQPAHLVTMYFPNPLNTAS